MKIPCCGAMKRHDGFVDTPNEYDMTWLANFR
jgi:hypothetical protein